MKKRKKIFKYADASTIGATAQVVDNSYCREINSGTDAELAGKEVIIRTRPVTIVIHDKTRKNAHPKKVEIVLAEYEGKIYRVVNCFRWIEFRMSMRDLGGLSGGYVESVEDADMIIVVGNRRPGT